MGFIATVNNIEESRRASWSPVWHRRRPLNANLRSVRPLNPNWVRYFLSWKLAALAINGLAELTSSPPLPSTPAEPEREGIPPARRPRPAAASEEALFTPVLRRWAAHRSGNLFFQPSKTACLDVTGGVDVAVVLRQAA